MAKRKICVSELTQEKATDAIRFVITDLEYTPVKLNEENCRASVYDFVIDTVSNPPVVTYNYSIQCEYQYVNGGDAHFCDYGEVSGQGNYELVDVDLTNCCAPTEPEIINPGWKLNDLSLAPEGAQEGILGVLNISFAIDNICKKTIICVNDVPCQEL